MSTSDLIETFKTMTLGELTDFRRRFEETFEVSGNAPAPLIHDLDHEPRPMAEEPTAFTVELCLIGPNKVRVIKAVRALTGVGLKEAKDLVESAPTDLLVNVTAEEADRAGAALTAEGAEVHVLPLVEPIGIAQPQ